MSCLAASLCVSDMTSDRVILWFQGLLWSTLRFFGEMYYILRVVNCVFVVPWRMDKKESIVLVKRAWHIMRGEHSSKIEDSLTVVLCHMYRRTEE